MKTEATPNVAHGSDTPETDAALKSKGSFSAVARGEDWNYIEPSFARSLERRLRAQSAELEQVKAERDMLLADRKEVVRRLNIVAAEGHFDGYDEDVELWRNVDSFYERCWDFWKEKFDAKESDLATATAQLAEERDAARAERDELDRLHKQALAVQDEYEMSERRHEQMRQVHDNSERRLIKERDAARAAADQSKEAVKLAANTINLLNRKARPIRKLLTDIKADYSHPWPGEEAGTTKHREAILARINEAIK